MKVYLPNVSDQEIGGGWTFMRNLRRGLEDRVEFVSDWRDCDIYFISGVTLAGRDEVEQVKTAGKLILFRVDNIPKKSNNKRSRVYDNMKRYGEVADIIVYQSEWAKEYAGWLANFSEATMDCIIYNGVDKKIFRPSPIPDDEETNRPLKYLYVQFNRDENKRFAEAAYHFHMRHREDPRIKLTLVGKFSADNFNDDGTPHFNFFGDENIEYIAPVADPYMMAAIYRDHDVLLFPAFADAAPNTVLEARSCGLQIELINPTGGTKEMVDSKLDISVDRMCDEYFDLFNNLMRVKS